MMKKIIILVVCIIVCGFSLIGQNVDIHLTPELLVKSMFRAISENDNCVLRDLCDPWGESTRGDALPICGLEYLDITEQEMYKNYFRNAYINGNTSYETMNGVSYANVPIIVGPNNDLKETIKLVNRNGKWFFLDM